MIEQLVVVGGGWAGCAAALTAAQKGLAVTLVERTDRLLASGLVGSCAIMAVLLPPKS